MEIFTLSLIKLLYFYGFAAAYYSGYVQGTLIHAEWEASGKKLDRVVCEDFNIPVRVSPFEIVIVEGFKCYSESAAMDSRY